jgi:EpsI family protein
VTEQTSESTAPKLRIGRRELLLGGTLVAAAGLTFAMDPRDHVSYLGGAKLQDLVPETIGDWNFVATSGLVLPPKDQLRDTIYSQLLTHVYQRDDGAVVMLLIAYSAAQDGVIQVHRPETCYPASGYRLIQNQSHEVPIDGPRHPRGRFIVADNNIRREQMIYWTRLGHYFPTRWAEQRVAVARENLSGRIPDGVLVRISTLDTGDGRILLDNFSRALFAAVPQRMKNVLIGG